MICSQWTLGTNIDNINISAEGSLSYYELKQHQAGFDGRDTKYHVEGSEPN